MQELMAGAMTQELYQRVEPVRSIDGLGGSDVMNLFGEKGGMKLVTTAMVAGRHSAGA